MLNKLTHPLTIYLIKELVSEDSEIVSSGVNNIEISGLGTLYYKDSFSRQPEWTKLFKGYDLERVFGSSASALLLVRASNRVFALSFGPGGRHFMQKGTYEERFGLIVTLNSIKKDSLRSIDTKTLESEGIQTRVQSSRPNPADNFGIDAERALVRSVTGESKDPDSFGKSLTGKDSLRVSLKCDLVDLKEYLGRYLQQFKKSDYKRNFPLFDKMREINDPIKIADLEEKLLVSMNAESNDNLWLTVPEILDWSDHGGFKYSATKRGNLLDDLHIDTFKKYLNKPSIDLVDLKVCSVYRFSQSNEYQKDHWKVYECIYFELSQVDATFFLTGGKWYEVKTDLVVTINNHFRSLSTSVPDIKFINYDHQRESDYNRDLAKTNKAFFVDADLIQIEGQSSFEFCDIYTGNKQMVHIKRYSGSSVLSHLFNQGYVSATFLLDEDFRKKINNKLDAPYKISDTTKRPNDTVGEYSVVFGIISKSSSSFELPFFSKLTLMHVANRLENVGFKVALVKIDNKRAAVGS